ncbi:MAG: alkaline phosphatase D family protein, partial [Bacteroidota bacterium]
LRFGVVSCSDYVDGYFHGYRKLAERNDIDAILHLGDYIYENGSAGSIGRPHEPPKRITELEDYRQRYSQYRLDADLRCAHQMYPFINVWDDHEVANNAWRDGAEAHDFPADGVWEHRKRMAIQAFYEWIPIRHPNPSDTARIYRTSHWGDLLDFMMLDTRIIARDEQASGAAIDDPNRNLLGPDQLSWLSAEMQNSGAQWKVIGQQVMMAPLLLPLIGPFTTDAWDGYRAERQRLYDTIVNNNIENVVVLTGDIHTSWANNLESGNDAVGVEFICSSISTLNSPFPVTVSIIQISNPHIRYVNLDDHGYYILDVNKQRAKADYYFVGDITDPNDNNETPEAFWFTNDGDMFLQEAQSATPPRPSLNVIQPSKDAPNPVGIGNAPETMALIGSY